MQSSSRTSGSLFTPEMREACTALLLLGLFAAVVKEVAERWKAVLKAQDQDDQLQKHLWGWESVRKELQDANRKVTWASYLRLGAATLATYQLVAGVARVMGLATGVATVLPLLSFGGAVIWREFGDLTVAQAIREWHSGVLLTRVGDWIRGRGSESSRGRIPTVVLTGFLGAGKTTLLNRLLAEGGRRGRKFAVIENEVGAVGIDGQLVAEGMTAEERQRVAPSFVELSDGCVCCTVRGDLQEALHSLLPKLRAQNVDTLLIETTGLAEPGPVVQTFLADEKLRKAYRVEGVVTVVDAKHIMQHLESSEATEERLARNAETQNDGGKLLSVEVRELSQHVLKLKKQQQLARAAIAGADTAMQANPQKTEKAVKFAMTEAERIEKELVSVREQFAQCRARLREPEMAGRKSEAAQQIAFADKVIINKIDLVSDEDAADVNISIATINPHAEVITASNADVSFDWILEPRPLTADREEQDKRGDDSDAATCSPCAPSTLPRAASVGGNWSRSWHGPKGGVVSLSLRTKHEVNLHLFNPWVFQVRSNQTSEANTEADVEKSVYQNMRHWILGVFLLSRSLKNTVHPFIDTREW
jgi:G3E family GTPase